MNEIRKKCSKCGRELTLERFPSKGNCCKNCHSAYSTEVNGTLTEENKVRIERMYKTIVPERMLDTSNCGVKLRYEDEIFVRLIDYKYAWVSNYGRILEYKKGRCVLKRTKKNDVGERICTLQKNMYDGEKWVWQKQQIEVWRLVVRCFIENFDFVGNTRCWHKDNDKDNLYYKDIYPVNEKQYTALLEYHMSATEVTEKLILNVCNDILYKADDWSTNKWKRTVFGKGYLGCSDAEATRDNYIYSKWQNMIQRCYDSKTQKLKPYYKECEVDVELLNYSNYREWHKENDMEGFKLDLDKDILGNGSKVYSIDTGTLVPHFTNTVFEERGFESNIYHSDITGKYNVFMSVLGKRNEVGMFDTEEEAKQAYIDYKQNYIRDFAEKSKGRVPYKTYEAMKNWVVEVA